MKVIFIKVVNLIFVQILIQNEGMNIRKIFIKVILIDINTIEMVNLGTLKVI